MSDEHNIPQNHIPPNKVEVGDISGMSGGEINIAGHDILVYNENHYHLHGEIRYENREALTKSENGRQRLEFVLPEHLPEEIFRHPEILQQVISNMASTLAVTLRIPIEEIQVIQATVGSIKLLFRLPTEAAIQFVKIKSPQAEVFAPQALNLSEFKFVLEDRDLHNVNLVEANLSGAILSGAVLSGSDLGDANLVGADLRGANLKGANLSWADLSGADLRSANLSSANLIGTSFRGADLRETDLNGTRLDWADLENARLSPRSRSPFRPISMLVMAVVLLILAILAYTFLVTPSQPAQTPSLTSEPTQIPGQTTALHSKNTPASTPVLTPTPGPTSTHVFAPLSTTVPPIASGPMLTRTPAPTWGQLATTTPVSSYNYCTNMPPLCIK